jgi:NAD(P)-dependent dehydrogenase (short-subunit alcohol dehydrogenase family)
MQTFKDKVAVITGAASGIGRGLAERCVQEGMKVVLADIEPTPLAQTEADLKAAGASVLAVVTDVSKARQVEALAQKTLGAFGAVHLLCNNAGVGAGTTIWESTQADWEWVMGVNLWSIIHGLRIFVPLMLEQKTDCQIVNTACMAGLTSPHPSASYGVTKHAVVALSEQLYHELAEKGSKIKVSVLCPGWVKTRILDAARNRPIHLQNTADPAQVASDVQTKAILDAMRPTLQAGISPQQVADEVFKAIREETFYILTHVGYNPLIQARLENILQGRNPTNPQT